MLFSKRLVSLLLVSSAALANDVVMETLSLQNRPGAEVRDLLQPMLEDSDRVIANGFSLIIKTTPARLENIRSLVQQLDTRLSNLLITVLQNSRKSAAELNAEAAIAVSPNAIQMRGMVGDTRQLSSNQAHQQLRTLEGQPAHIKTGAIRPVETFSTYSNGYGYQGISRNQQMVEASSGFEVTPRLSGDQVLIDVAPWSDRLQRGGVIETQQAQTVIRTRLGAWVEIAASNNQDNSDQRGFNGFNHSTRQNDLHILLKVDRAD